MGNGVGGVGGSGSGRPPWWKVPPPNPAMPTGNPTDKPIQPPEKKPPQGGFPESKPPRDSHPLEGWIILGVFVAAVVLYKLMMWLEGR